jgi:hypothetical protein
MTELKTAKLYFPPSVLSMLIGIMLCGGYVGLVIYSIGLKSGSLYEAILGGNSSLRQVNNFQEQMSIISSQVAENRAITRFPTFMLWVLIGLVVYAVTEGLINLIKDLVEIKKETKYVHALESHVYKSVLKRLTVRMGFVLLIVIYVSIFSNRILPFCVKLLQVAAYALTNPLSILYIILALSILLVVFHGLVVLLRFYSLRPRVLSSTSD